MAFDSSAAYSIVQTDSGQELYEQGGTYYKRFSPYDAVSPPLQYNQSVDASLTNPGNATAIAAAALAGGANGQWNRGVAPTWFPRSSIYAAGGSTNYTWAQMIAAPADFCAVRIGIPNFQNAEQTGITATVSPTESAANISVPLVSGSKVSDTWQAVTWGGAGSATCPVGTAVAPTWTWSDWTPCLSKARADVVGAKPLLLVRLYMPTAGAAGFAYLTTSGNSGSANGANAVYEGLHGGAYIWRFALGSGDLVTSPNTTDMGTSAAASVTIAVQFRTLSRVLPIMVVGDSIAQGYQATAVAPWINRAAAAAGVPCIANYAYSGLTSTQYLAVLKARISEVAPRIVVIPGLTPNDNMATDALLAASLSNLCDALETIRSANATAVVTTVLPKDGSAEGEVARKRIADNYIRSLASGDVKIIDFAALHSATWGTWATGTGFDSVHPNEAGTLLMEAAAAPVFASLVGLLS